MKKNAKYIAALSATMLATAPAFASGHTHELEAMYMLDTIFICAAGITLFSLVLSIVSYRTASKVLSVLAWATTIPSFIIAAGLIAFIGGMGSAMSKGVILAPFVAIAFLLARREKMSEGRRFVVAYILRCIAVVSLLFFVEAYFRPFNFLGAFLGQYASTIVIAISATVLLGVLVYRLLLKAPEKNVDPMISPVTACLIIGIGTFVIQMVNTMLVMRSYGGVEAMVRVVTSPYIYSTVIINIVLSIATGFVVRAVYKGRKVRSV